jgi:transposase
VSYFARISVTTLLLVVKLKVLKPVLLLIAQKTALRMAAQTLCRSDSALGAYYRPKAITAIAHKLARIFYRLWTSGEAFVAPSIDAYEQQYHDRMLKNLKKKAQALGLELIPIPTPLECVS